MRESADRYPQLPSDRLFSISDRPTVAELQELFRHVSPAAAVWVAHGPAGVRELTAQAMPASMTPTRAGAIILQLPSVPPPEVAPGYLPPPPKPATTAADEPPRLPWTARLWHRLVG